MSKKARDFIKTKEAKIFWVLLVVALILRFIGLRHGEPFIFHPDEPSVIRSAHGLRFEPNPKHFDWPHLHFYINSYLYVYFSKFRNRLELAGLKDNFIYLWNEPFIFYYLSRAVTALMGAFTLIPVYLTGKTLFNKKVALYAAAILAVIPFHVHASHFALIDVPMVFWLSWGLFFSSKILYSTKYKYYLLSGLFIGLAASTKYNGGLLAFTVPLAHLLRVMRNKEEKLVSVRAFFSLLVSGIAAFSGFILGTPYALLDFKTFSSTDSPKGAFWQFTNVGSVSSSTQLSQFFDSMTVKLIDDFGITFLVLYLVAFVLAAVVTINKRCESWTLFNGKLRETWFLLLPSMFIFYYTSGFEKVRSHYFFMVYPFVAIVAAFILYKMATFLPKLRVPIVAIVFALPLYFVGLDLYELVREDTRQILFYWLEKEATPETKIYYSNRETKIVLDEFENSSEGVKDISPQEKNALVVLTLSDDEYFDHLNGIGEYSSLQNDYKEELFISSRLRRGPTILVYGEPIEE